MVILKDYVDSASDPIYDVFLSFRGPDTRHGFTDHLYHQLIGAAIPTFRDDDELEKGEPLKQQLEKAIKESSVSVIIFYEDLASSSWCLDEVVRILQQRKIRPNHKVLPIFYKVEASDVRHQKGSYEKSFDRHTQKGHVSFDKIQVWKAALKEAADLVGLGLSKDKGGSETEFIGRILSEVRKSLPNRKALDVPEHFVGMDHWTDVINPWFKEDNNVLLIWGIGGIGKTTIAKHFFNEYVQDFDGSCFLAMTAELWNKTEIGLRDLQCTLLSNILNQQREKTTISNSEEGTKNIVRALRNKKVLVVLDDVNETELLYALLGHCPQRFCPGSKIIVTSRNISLRKDFTIPPMVHNVKVLSSEDSLELFSWHAFQQCHPSEENKQLSEEILLRCEGLPLALKVLGSSLRKNLDTVSWKKQLQKWDEIVNPGIQQVLQISYDSLEDNTVKNLFLHVACFFVGEEEDYVLKILDHCDLYASVGIQNLIDRCLITRYYGKLIMHQMIQDMGREIVRQKSPDQPWKRSRLWYHEDSFSVLKYDKGTEEIEGLVLDGQKINKLDSDGSGFAAADANPITKLLGYVKKKKEAVCDRLLYSKEGDLKFDAFAKMINLKLVKLNYVHLTGNCNKFPKELRWISWHGFPLEYLPMELPLYNLVVFDLRHSHLKQVWSGYMEVKSLKFLNLSYSTELCQTPDFRGLPELERLILRGCSNLVKVCKTIGILKGLALLDLRGCKSLRNLPALPESIVNLELSGCYIDEFPREQQNVDSIFDWHRIVKFAYPSIGTGPVKLLDYIPHSLVRLNLEDCNLTDESFPRDFSHLSSLFNLNLNGNLISRLPDSLKNLSNSNLRQLSMCFCPQLQSVIHAPSSVMELLIKGNRRLKKTKARVDSRYFRLQIDERSRYVEIEGCWKRVQAWSVDRKVIKNLGLESVTIGSDPRVRYEYGIFSTFVEGREVPRCFATYSITSTSEAIIGSSDGISSFSYAIPSSLGKKIQGLNICTTVTLKLTEQRDWTCQFAVKICLRHTMKDLKWSYWNTQKFEDKKMYKDILWVSTWKCEDLFEDGDEVEVSIEVVSFFGVFEVKECGIRTVYEENDLDDNIITPLQEEEEEEEEDTDSLRWTDKMNVSFTDYAISIPGVTFVTVLIGFPFCGPHWRFLEDMQRQGTRAIFVDHWGLKQPNRERKITTYPSEDKRLSTWFLPGTNEQLFEILLG